MPSQFTKSMAQAAMILGVALPMAHGNDFYAVTADEVIVAPVGDFPPPAQHIHWGGIWAADAFPDDTTECTAGDPALLDNLVSPPLPLCNADEESFELGVTDDWANKCGLVTGDTIHFHKDVSGQWWDATVNDEVTIVSKCVAPDGCEPGGAGATFDGIDCLYGPDNNYIISAAYLCTDIEAVTSGDFVGIQC
ncbi:uncharacterized protein LTR77_002972 [Saxophila tyrrhenica]|uniref:Uncharacterized protein n=1 Tax=Saxophila tyrrhenica TaxID=1690608 RepID=A0AAV9PJL9_9PEZI|nr:hypothetical protein LTR77_002972 [Saxophila tyrrhenica]